MKSELNGIFSTVAESMKKKDKYKRMKPDDGSRMTDVPDGASLKKHLQMGKVSPYGGKFVKKQMR